MDFNESPIESNWSTTSVKQEVENDVERKPKTRPKENRNFCERWLSLFSPWLTRCEDNSNRPFCRACQRPLDNNRFRLQRHERTAKHARNQEILLNEGEDAVRLILSNCRQRRRYIKKETPVKPYSYNNERTTEPKTPSKSLKLSKTIDKTIEKNEFGSFKPAKREFHNKSDYNYSPNRYSRPHPAPPRPKKDSFDMFFEAISASVKSLPPKLAAEVKSRISQVISEFELRAICEREAQENAIIAVPVTNVVTIDPEITTETHITNTNAVNSPTTESAPTVAQYVYSYQKRAT